MQRCFPFQVKGYVFRCKPKIKTEKTRGNGKLEVIQKKHPHFSIFFMEEESMLQKKKIRGLEKY